MDDIQTKRTVEINGMTYIVPEGTDVRVKFVDKRDKMHDTPEAAKLANAVEDIREIVEGAADFRNESYDINDVLSEAPKLLEALQRYMGLAVTP